MEAFQNRSLAFGIGAALEVPDNCWATDYELSTAHKESINPEKHKNLEKEYKPSRVGPFYFSHERIRCITGFRSSRRENHYRTAKPQEHPQHADKEA